MAASTSCNDWLGNDMWFFDKGSRSALFGRNDGPSSGMWKIGEEKISPGHRYYRFGERRKNYENFSSPWWIDHQTFKEIVLWGRAAEHSNQQAGKLRLAIADKFSACDVVVSVKFNMRLRAFTGPGRKIFGDVNSESMIWAPPQDIKQFFIPGMWIEELRNKVQYDRKVESAEVCMLETEQ